ncbi:hypothetical protein Pla52n_24650 [Stieleria varia]|uniref:Uncharacterized protein n=1 Tax=Stieleria varia TaxID=2528005 RepID=A0A5C6B204_9BACT|nr:hypothetical protein Pla52n_24650 [Stieleria varia]
MSLGVSYRVARGFAMSGKGPRCLAVRAYFRARLVSSELYPTST